MVLDPACTRRLCRRTQVAPRTSAIWDALKAVPEEVYGGKIFSQRLVNDYGDARVHVRSHPEWRMKIRWSDVAEE